MNRIDKCFIDKSKKLITFMVINDPDFETSINACKAMIDNGADIIELGIPFSDPVAEGGVIQAANERAMKSGFEMSRVFEFVKIIREYNKDIPLLFLNYYNVIYRYGREKFLDKAKIAGLDGFIIPDLPFEEKNEFYPMVKEKDMNLISLVSLTSEDRIEAITKEADNFLYCVSSMGVTGTREEMNSRIFELPKKIEKYSKVKKAVGFGISKPEHIIKLAPYFDGIIIGSAIVKVFDNDNKELIVDKVGNMVNEFKKTLKDVDD